MNPEIYSPAESPTGHRPKTDENGIVRLRYELNRDDCPSLVRACLLVMIELKSQPWAVGPSGTVKDDDMLRAAMTAGLIAEVKVLAEDENVQISPILLNLKSDVCEADGDGMIDSDKQALRDTAMKLLYTLKTMAWAVDKARRK